MTTRDKKICKAILTVLHNLDGGQSEELPLHGEVNLMVSCSLSEFNIALGICDGNGWVTGVSGRFTGRKKWNINDAGESARMEMA